MNLVDMAVRREVLRLHAVTTSHRIVEIGAGSGTLAREILDRNADCRYLATDLSGRLLRLAATKIAPHHERTLLVRVDPEPRQPLASGIADLLISLYVVDMLEPSGIRALFDEAYRILPPSGTLCLVGMHPGQRPTWAERLWLWLYRIDPGWVGGSRPVQIEPYIDPERWENVRIRTVECWGLTSGIVTATRRR